MSVRSAWFKNLALYENFRFWSSADDPLRGTVPLTERYTKTGPKAYTGPDGLTRQIAKGRTLVLADCPPVGKPDG